MRSLQIRAYDSMHKEWAMAFDFQVNNFSAFPFPTIQWLIQCIVAFDNWVCDLEAQCMSRTSVRKSGFAFPLSLPLAYKTMSQGVSVAYRNAVQPNNHMSKNLLLTLT
jgi:hypothetical protein